MPLKDVDEDSWLDFLSPAAALWAAAAMFAAGRGRPDRWRQRLPGLDGPVRIAVALIGVLIAVGVANRLLRPWLSDLWLGRRLGRSLEFVARRRRERWDAAHTAAMDGPSEERSSQAAIRNRIALARPVSATWMGDRLAALDSRVRNEYGLDLASVWPRLWLVVPEQCRAELRTASRSWHLATSWGVWGLFYAGLALAWPPLLVVGMLTFGAALSSARRAVAAATDLAEAAFDLYALDVADRLGIAAPERKVTPEVGRSITGRFRKSG